MINPELSFDELLHQATALQAQCDMLTVALELASKHTQPHSMQCKSEWIPDPRDSCYGRTDDITGCVCHIRKIHEALAQAAKGKK